MLDHFSEPTLVALIGLLGGILLGLAARLGRFCTLGAIEDALYGANLLRLKMWGIAIGVAILGTYSLVALGLLDLQATLYLSRSWNPFESIFGGLLFGYGMALAGNCGYGALARVGGGDLRALLLVIVMGVSAYITLNGPLAGVRIWLFGPPQEAQSLPSFAQNLATISGASVAVSGMVIGAVILAVSLLNRDLRHAPKSLFFSLIVGVAIVFGWAGTQGVARHGFDSTAVISHTFSAPIGETLLYLMTSSGNALSFGIGSVCGVLMGAFIGSLIKGHFRWEACDEPTELRRQMMGAGLMGIGAVLAVGCSVGQGLSAFSVLAYSAPVTCICIFIGAAIGLRQLIIGFGPSI